MIYIAIITILLYYFVLMIYYKRLFPVQGTRKIQIFLTLVIVAMAYSQFNVQALRWIRLPFVMAVMTVGLRCSTGMNWLQSAYGGGVSVLSAYCFRGLFASAGLIMFQSYRLTKTTNAYYIIAIIAFIFAYLFFKLIRNTICPDDKLKRFINNRSQLRLVVAYEIVAALNINIINVGRDLSPYNIWYTGVDLSMHGLWYLAVAMGSFLLTIGMLVYVIYESIESTELMEYQWRAKAMEEQLEQQLRHYKSYQKYTEGFRAFKHDFKSMMASLKALIRTQNYEKAIQLIDTLYDDMQKRSIVHKEYSNHLVLDAMLQDKAILCEEKGIRFSFKVFAPRNTGVSMLDGIRIFSNITNNAIEACEKVPESKRFIDISSRDDAHWATLEASNSYDGTILSKNGVLITTKSDKEKHGLG